MKNAALLLIAASTIACSATTPSTAATPSGAVTPTEVSRVLSALADDSLEGRMTGSAGGAKAARFIAEEFRKAGLEAVGDSGYFQRVPIVIRRRQDGRVSAGRVASFAVRDTFPADQRGTAVNVVGVIRGTDPMLKDSVVLVDAHYDHIGMAVAGRDIGGKRDSIF